jgi:hypothetical protein
MLTKLGYLFKKYSTINMKNGKPIDKNTDMDQENTDDIHHHHRISKY